MGSASKKRAQARVNRAAETPASPVEFSTNFVSNTSATPAPASATSSVNNTVAQTAEEFTETLITLPEPPFFAATSSPAPTLTFRQFFQLADTDTLKKFITAAAILPETRNLAVLWNRAFQDGYKEGRSDSYEVGLENGFGQGYEEGFDAGRKSIHGDRSSGPVVAVLESTSTQTDDFDHPQLQTPPSLEIGTQTEPPAPLLDATSPVDPPVPISATANSVFVATSPAPLLINCDETTVQNATASSSATVDTPRASPPPDPIKKLSKSVTNSSHTLESGPLNPALAPSAHQKILNTSPLHKPVPSPLFPAKTDSKNFNWSDEPCAFDSGPPIGYPPLPTPPKFGPRDFSGLCSGSDPWRSLQHRKGRGRRPRRRNPGLRQQNPKYYQNSPLPNFRSSYSVHTPHPPPFSPSVMANSPLLNWDQDPRLADLSRALRALGWVRR
jgi:hypothetical protein